MSNRYFAIDIGSTTIKGCSVDVSRNGIKLNSKVEKPIPQDQLLLKQTLGEVLTSIGAVKKDKIVVGINDGVFVRTLHFPFSDIKKVEPLIKYELLDKIPLDDEESVIAYNFLNLKGESKSRVLASAAVKEKIFQLISNFQDYNTEIHRIVFSPNRSVNLVPQSIEPVLVVDIGGKHTELTIVMNGKIYGVRVIRSGMENLIKMLSDYSGQDIDSVRNWIETSGSINKEVEDEEGFEKIIRDKITADMENWRRFIISSETEINSKISKIYLTGSGANFSGITNWSREFFEMPTEHIPAFPGMDHKDTSLVALALLAPKNYHDILDFRQGEFARNASYSLIKDKAFAVVLGLAVFFSLIVISGFLTLHTLEREEKDLLGAVGALSREVLGKKIYSPYVIKRKIKKRKKKSKKGALGDNPLPQMSAYVLLSEISKNLPPRKEIKKEDDEKNKDEKIKTEKKIKKPIKRTTRKAKNGKSKSGLHPVALDIKEIKIKSGHIKFIGLVDTAQDVDEISKGLKKIKCIDKINTGKIKTIGKDKTERKEFTLDIEMNCL